MINEQSTKKRTESIIKLLTGLQLKEALSLLRKAVEEVSDWSVTSRFEELSISYNYMLQYYRQGMKDKLRNDLYKELIGKALLLSTDTERLLLKSISNNDYYIQLRNKPDGNITQYRMILESDIIDIAEHDKSMKNLFNQIWTDGQWQKETMNEVSMMLESPLIKEADASLIISAVTMALLQYFDPRKYQLLGLSVKNIYQDVATRALTGLLIVNVKYNDIIPYFIGAVKQSALLSEIPGIAESARIVQLALLMCRETQKIDQKMQETIIPSMLHNSKLGDMLSEDIDTDDINPDWNTRNDRTLKNLLIEMTELQMEGADVYMSTFSHLKGYPFFDDVANWFRPFSDDQPDICDITNKMRLKNTSISKTIFNSTVFCNSDKYSFCFTFSQIPQQQRNMILSQLESQADLEQEEAASILDGKTARIEILAKQYIQDLYRFFRLYSHKEQFYDPFSSDLNMLHCKASESLFRSSTTKLSIAEFLIKKGYYKEAASIFSVIANEDDKVSTDYQFYQKAGYANQCCHNYAIAIECYNRADILEPDNIWTMRHMAQCHRITGEPGKAIDILYSAEKIDKDNLPIQIQIGECLLDLKRYKDALSRFFKVEFLKPEMIKVWRAIAWCAFLAKKNDQATKYYDRLISSNDPAAQDYLNAGHVAWCRGNIEKAVALYSECIKLEGIDKFREDFSIDFGILNEKGISQTDYRLMLDLL